MRMFTVFFGSPYCGDKERAPIQHSQTNEDFDKSMEQVRYIAYQIIGPTLIITGILGNILNLIVLARPFLNDCTRLYLRALAIADIHVLIFEIPMIIRLNYMESGTLWVALYYAHLELVLVTTFLAFNVYIVICLTIERYVSVYLPTMFNAMHTIKKATIALVLCFTVAILVSSPLFMLKITCRTNSTCHKWSYKDNFAITETKYWHVYIIISEITIRIGPAVLLAILNILIIRKFNIIANNRNKIHITNITLGTKPTSMTILRNKKYQDEKRLVVLLQAVVVLFFATMIPSSCLSFLYSEYRETDLTFQIFRSIANLLEIANSSLNFCAYFLCSKEFRKGLLHVIIGRNSAVDDLKTANNGNVNDMTTATVKTISNGSINITSSI